MASELIIQGARQNNLRNIDLVIPHDCVTVVTGVSGSGKSSLAFDTVFAEGQWRYIESLSAYARMFIEKLDRPDLDKIMNVRPAVALEQRNPVRTSRSTLERFPNSTITSGCSLQESGRFSAPPAAAR